MIYDNTMDNIKEILNTIDKLNSESKLDEVEQYLADKLEEARAEGNIETALTILNEQAGFYRDTGKFDKAIKACRLSEDFLDEKGEGDTKERAAAFLNTANVYRACGELSSSFEYFEKAEKILQNYDDDYLNANYYNNLALLYQESNKFEEAVDCLKKALYIAEDKMHDEIKIAISRTNLANSLLHIKKTKEAEEILAPAIKIFEGRTPSDFHYSAALSTLADIAITKGDIRSAAHYYEMAKSEIKLHMGENNFYKIIDDALESLYQLNDGRPSLPGLVLSKMYYKAFGAPVLKRNFSEILDHIAVGLAGEGSECLGYDDESSIDHDFGPGFIIWVDDTVSEDDFSRLCKAYSLLPKEYMGINRLETIQGRGRVGVIRLSDFLKKATGYDHVPIGINEWQNTIDENLILFINGEVFLDKGNIISSLREQIKKEQPYYVYFMKLSVQLERMAKYGQYGYERALGRGDSVTMMLAKADFMKASMRAMHIIAGKYAPYSKWLRRSLADISEFKDAALYLDELSVSDNVKDDFTYIQKICLAVKKSLENRGLINCEEDYLAVAATQIRNLANRTIIADAIVEYEWAAFDKTQNAGGRANCQDDWQTFSIMRRSQYYSWPMELLQTVYADFVEADKNGRNVISEKYGYMMESTFPGEFEKIKSLLPPVDEDKKEIIENIVSIQVAMMEDFAEKYPHLAGNARSIHTSEDTPYLTSYETYLRGELKTYHPDSLSMYGRFVAILAANGENIAKKTMNMTAFLYGYESLEKAEERL